MSATTIPRSPLASLVLFICCIAMAASILATAHYVVVDLPAQNNVQAPENALLSTEDCNLCKKNCKAPSVDDHIECIRQCEEIQCSGVIKS